MRRQYSSTPWAPAQEAPASAARQPLPGMETQTSTPARVASFQSDVLVPFCQAGVTDVLLGLLVAARMRRKEAASLRLEDVMLQPMDDRSRVVLDVRGKGSKARVVPISDRLAAAIEEWGTVVGSQGQVVLAPVKQALAVDSQAHARPVAGLPDGEEGRVGP